jgi:hypothetical protein
VVAKLPINSYTSLVVDSAHQHVFVSDSTSYAVPVAADGTFTLHDLPGTTRYVTCTVDYAGDALHQAGTASATVLVTRH